MYWTKTVAENWDSKTPSVGTILVYHSAVSGVRKEKFNQSHIATEHFVPGGQTWAK